MFRRNGKFFIWILVFISIFSILASTAHANIARNQYAFSEFKNLIENQYIFRDYKGVNWEDLYSRHENQILNSQTDDQFAENLGKLVTEIKDGHFRVYDTKRNQIDTNSWLWLTLQSNWNLNAISRIVPNLQQRNQIISTSIVDNVGYLMINSWASGSSVGGMEPEFEILPELLQTDFLNTDALIIDIRMNGGGNTDNERPFTRYFREIDINKPVEEQYILVGYWETIQTIFDDKQIFPYYQSGITKEQGIAYTKPVIILMGNHSASTSEDFLINMMYFPNITTMGDKSMGSVGNPKEHILSNGINVHVPYAADFDINMVNIEDVGITPDIYVPFVNDGSDNVLIRAFADLGVVVGNNNEISSGKNGGCSTNSYGIFIIFIMLIFNVQKKMVINKKYT